MKIITEPKLQLVLNKKEAKGIHKVYVDMLDLLKLKKNWIKGKLTGVDDYGNVRYCLLGALNHVDGKWEELAQAFMYLNPPKNWEFDEDIGDIQEDEDGNEVGIVVELDDMSQTANEAIPEFNDYSETEHKDITAWLKSLIKKTEKIIAA